jgi:RNA polymerase sigma-70 factor, ECF subfamily
MPLNESELISRVQSGEAEYFGELYESYARRIFVFIYYKTHHRETAEDLTSKTFMKALEKISTFDSDKGSFNSWIYQIARNLVCDHYRSLKFTKDIEDVWDLSSSEDIARDIGNKDQLEEVRVGLQKLSPSQREIIILRVWEGLSYAEIAEAVGKSEAACKMDFGRGVKSLKKEILLLLLVTPLMF